MRRRTHAAWLVASTLFCMVPSAAFADGVAPSQATSVQRKQAQSSFIEGREAFERADYATAATRFEASLDVVDSPNTRLYLARSLREAGRPVDAYREYSRTEAEAHKEAAYKGAGAAARDEKASLASSVALVQLDVKNPDSSTTVTVGGTEVPQTSWSEPVAVSPGETEVTATRSGKATVKKTVHAAPGSPTPVTLDLDAPDAAGSTREPSTVATGSADHANLRPYAYVAGAVGAVGLLTFVIAGISANSTYGDLESSCPNGRCPANQQDAISRGRTQQTVANVGLVFGVVGAAAGVTLFVLSMPKKDSASGPTPSAALRVGPAGTVLLGRF